MVRSSFLLVGYATAGELGSLMQSAHSDLASAESVSLRLNRLNELQLTTKRMEAEYKAMAKAIISKQIDPETGRPYEAPNAVNFGLLQDQFDNLLRQLAEEKNTNQNLVLAENAKVTQCNTDRDTAYNADPGGVNVRLATQQGARRAHNACRASENTHIETRQDKCDNFVSQKFCEYVDDTHAANSDNQHTIFATDDEGDLLAKLMTTITHATECKNALASEKTKSGECDAAQVEFELRFCEYDQVLTDTCQVLDACYLRTTTDRQAVVDGVKELETNQKVVYKMIQKVKCYVDKMQSKFKTLTNADLAACESMSIDASSLNINYPDADQKAPCDKSLLANGAPGDESWAIAEYNATLHHLHNGGDASSGYHGFGAGVISKIEAITDCATHLR